MLRCYSVIVKALALFCIYLGGKYSISVRGEYLTGLSSVPHYMLIKCAKNECAQRRERSKSLQQKEKSPVWEIRGDVLAKIKPKAGRV